MLLLHVILFNSIVVVVVLLNEIWYNHHQFVELDNK
jgi:hypothetical protein